MKEWFLDHIAEWFFAAFGGLSLWLVNRSVKKVDRLDERLTLVERKTVTKDDFDELRESMNATFVNGMQRLEARQDQILFRMMKRDDL